jgi:uroporphyrinogen III methyltransferase/synthase
MNKPLEGRTVIVTRAASQAGEFVTELENYGANVLVCPTIEISEPESYERLDEAIDHLYGYDWLIFTSANGVEYFTRRLRVRGVKVEELDEIKVCSIGEATADKLRDAHIHVDVVPSQSKAEGVFAALSEFAGGSAELRGLNVLIPRAGMGRDYLPKALEAVGARVDVVTAYRTVLPANLDRGRVTAMLTGSGDCIAFMSSSSVKNLGLLFDTHDLSHVLKDLTVACIGDVTATTATEFGLHVDIQPSETTATSLAQAIAEYYSRHR